MFLFAKCNQKFWFIPHFLLPGSRCVSVNMFVVQPVSYQLWSDRKDRFALICSFIDIYVDIWKGIKHNYDVSMLTTEWGWVRCSVSISGQLLCGVSCAQPLPILPPCHCFLATNIRQRRFLSKPPRMSICNLYNRQKGLCSWLFLTCRGLNYFPDNLLREMCGAGRIWRIYPSISIPNANVAELGRRMVTVGLCRARRHAIDLPASGLCRMENEILKWNIQQGMQQY